MIWKSARLTLALFALIGASPAQTPFKTLSYREFGLRQKPDLMITFLYRGQFTARVVDGKRLRTFTFDTNEFHVSEITDSVAAPVSMNEAEFRERLGKRKEQEARDGTESRPIRLNGRELKSNVNEVLIHENDGWHTLAALSEHCEGNGFPAFFLDEDHIALNTCKETHVVEHGGMLLYVLPKGFFDPRNFVIRRTAVVSLEESYNTLHDEMPWSEKGGISGARISIFCISDGKRMFQLDWRRSLNTAPEAQLSLDGSIVAITSDAEIRFYRVNQTGCSIPGKTQN